MIKNEKAFTLSEVLIVIGIIGIVSSMTIPSLVRKIKDDNLQKAFKEDYSILSSAVASLKYDNGGDIVGSFTDAKSIISALSTKIKMTKKCASSFSGDCWLPINKYYFLDNAQYNWSTGQSGAVLLNGSAITAEVLSGDLNKNWIGKSKKFDICATVTIDANGKKPPNIFGRDLYSVWITSSGIRPYGADDYFTCKRISGSYAGQGCAATVLMETEY